MTCRPAVLGRYGIQEIQRVMDSRSRMVPWSNSAVLAFSADCDLPFSRSRSFENRVGTGMTLVLHSSSIVVGRLKCIGIAPGLGTETPTRPASAAPGKIGSDCGRRTKGGRRRRATAIPSRPALERRFESTQTSRRERQEPSSQNAEVPCNHSRRW